jgi:diguanylate cyclase (GGDEF)-like protein/PAS domain S-box-containing protein
MRFAGALNQLSCVQSAHNHCINDGEAMSLTAEEEALAQLDLNQVLEAHLNWTSRLKSVLDGTSIEKLDVSVVCQDNACVLGKWIYGPAKNSHAGQPEWEELRTAHANFHLCAGEVLKAHQQGNAETAKTLLKGPMAFASQKNKDALVKLYTLRARTNILDKLLHFDASSVKHNMVWYTFTVLAAIIFIAVASSQLFNSMPSLEMWHDTALASWHEAWVQNPLGIWSKVLLDAAFITLFVFPVVYFQVLRPMMENIKIRKLAEESLRVTAAAFETNQSTVITDANERVLKVNRAYIETTGYSAEEVIGQIPRSIETEKQDKKYFAAAKEQVKTTGAWQGEVLNRRKNGQVYLTQMHITAVYGDDGALTNFVLTFADLTEQKAAEKEINDLVFFDPLTGLPNRRMLMDRLKHALALGNRNQRQDALLYIDLDNFKTLNDTMGHGKGDMLLQQTSTRLRACIRDCDTVARIGGDEFVVMLEGLNRNATEAAAEAEVIAKKILNSLNRPYQLADTSFQGSASLGIALFVEHPESVDDLLKRADLAMYQAKSSGRNTLQFFDPAMQKVANDRAALEIDLRHAIAENQLELYFQSQVDQDQKIVGAEALIRWNHPTRGLVPPFHFIPLAEEVGLILPIGLWVLERACIQLKAWEKNEHAQHIQLAINVSPLQFRQTDFVEQVTKVLQKNKIIPSRLKIELTESMMFDNIEDTIIKMQKLKETGVLFSMDDFGTGYSSLSYLTRLPLDQLKIDQSFVRNIGVHNNDAVIVQTIIGMTHNLGMTVIAEGVETEAQRTFLEQNGCLNFQGYLFSRPIPLTDFEKLLAK